MKYQNIYEQNEKSKIYIQYYIALCQKAFEQIESTIIKLRLHNQIIL